MSDPANPYDSPGEKSTDDDLIRKRRHWILWTGMFFIVWLIVAVGLAYWYFVDLPIHRYYGV